MTRQGDPVDLARLGQEQVANPLTFVLFFFLLKRRSNLKKNRPAEPVTGSDLKTMVYVLGFKV